MVPGSSAAMNLDRGRQSKGFDIWTKVVESHWLSDKGYNESKILSNIMSFAQKVLEIKNE